MHGHPKGPESPYNVIELPSLQREKLCTFPMPFCDAYEKSSSTVSDFTKTLLSLPPLPLVMVMILVLLFDVWLA